jgi:hypothetical protein
MALVAIRENNNSNNNNNNNNKRISFSAVITQ